MVSVSTRASKDPVLNLSICLTAVFLLIFALPAFGQQVHQLSYNGSSWMDQNLNGALAGPYTGISAFLTTPNDQTHAYYVDNNGNYDVHQLFFNGTSWSDQDLTVISGAAKGAYGAAQVGSMVQRRLANREIAIRGALICAGKNRPRTN